MCHTPCLSLRLGKAPEDDVRLNARCGLPPRESAVLRGGLPAIVYLSAVPPRRRGDCHPPGSTLYHTCSAPAAPAMAIHRHHHFSRNAVRYVPAALYSHSCGKPVLRRLGKPAVLLLTGQQSKLCLEGLGFYFPLSFNCSFFVWLVFLQEFGVEQLHPPFQAGTTN